MTTAVATMAGLPWYTRDLLGRKIERVAALDLLSDFVGSNLTSSPRTVTYAFASTVPVIVGAMTEFPCRSSS